MSATTSFDTNAYRKTVLAPLAAQPQRDLHDLFALVDLPPDVDDEALVAERVDQVVAFWQRERGSPKYASLAAELLAQREELRRVLLDPAERRVLAARITGARTQAAAARFARLDALVARLVERSGGVAAEKLEQLREVARRDGIGGAEFDAHMRDVRVLEGQPSDAADALPAGVRSQVRRGLDELARLRAAAGEDRTYRSLFDFLGVEERASTERLRERHAALVAQNRRRRHDRERTVTDELLALGVTLLIEGDRSRYLGGLVEDVKDRLRPEVETAVVVDDRLTAAEFERLVREAVHDGLGPDVARRAVTDLAHSIGGVVEAGAFVDYVTCAVCGTAERLGGRRTCRRCGADLYQTCPRCGAEAAASAATCPQCDLDLRVVTEARAALSAVRAALAEGRLAGARQDVQRLAAGAEWLPEVGSLRAAVEQAWQAAREDWTRLRQAVEGRRMTEAARLIERLRGTAADVPGPDSTGLTEVSQLVEGRLAAARAAVADAREVHGTERERRLLAVLDAVADAGNALEALAEIPVAAPSRLTALLAGDGSVRLAWRRSPSPGPVRYRVTRLLGGSAGEERRTLATIGETRVEDAGAVAGSVVAYEVVALRASLPQRPSGAARTEPLLVAREVDGLRAEAGDGVVTLRWEPVAALAQVKVERLPVDADPSEPARRTSARRDGHVDRDVSNGTAYRYRVPVTYRGPAGPVRTAGRIVVSRPNAPPRPVLDLAATTGAGERTIMLRWSAPPTGEVRVLRCRSDPGMRTGQALRPDEVAALGDALSAGPRPATALDHQLGGVRWYLPVTLEGDQVVAGAALRSLGLDQVADLAARQDGGEVVVTWRWPPGCTEALVALRPGAAVEGPDDGKARTAKTTNVAYELGQGWRRALDGVQGRYMVAVYPGARIEGTLEWDRDAAATTELEWTVHGRPPR